MGCKIEPIDKKEFGIRTYSLLKQKYGYKNHYEVSEIKEAFEELGYPSTWLCWAMIAFMLPANVGEYFRAIGKPVNVIEIKRTFIKEMTDGKNDRLNVPTFDVSDNTPEEYDIDIFNIDRITLVDIIEAYHGDDTRLSINLEYNWL